MIVEQPPYDMVAVFADADAKLFFEQVIERVQARGRARSIRWRSIRHARRDAFRVDPVTVVEPFRSVGARRFLFTWDHHGSGREVVSPADSEAEVLDLLSRAGYDRNDCEAVAFVPELEAVLAPGWERVKQVIADIRRVTVPSDEEVLRVANRRARPSRIALPPDFTDAIQRHPKEVFDGLLGVLNLRRSASLFDRLGEQLSLARLQDQPQMRRITNRLVEWFPPVASR